MAEWKSAIFVEMERIRQTVAIMLVALTVVVTVFQCHHHDASGHAFFLLGEDEELAVGEGLQRADCHSHDCEEGEDEAATGCGMHLTDALTMCSVSRLLEAVDMLSYCPVDYFFDFRVTETAVVTTEIARRIEGESEGYSRVSRLRGPPCV